jgi:hypothetical protein
MRLDPCKLNLHFSPLSHTCCINKYAWRQRGSLASLIKSAGPTSTLFSTTGRILFRLVSINTSSMEYTSCCSIHNCCVHNHGMKPDFSNTAPTRIFTLKKKSGKHLTDIMLSIQHEMKMSGIVGLSSHRSWNFSHDYTMKLQNYVSDSYDSHQMTTANSLG